ncbi:serine/threonine-protein kinase [Salinigranum halophilum]|uniref:serine/threonine-protein kinase n=1 Tax=Salinigranum halophilum TaxID=2565931 RepID=UPI00115F7177|nr:serine/threonine-protein kinase [Salinigranum halophilum]
MRIDSGGNADVYHSSVTTGGDSHEVAVKFPRGYGTIQRDQVQQLLDEAENCSKLDDHPHIVTVFGYGAESGLPWIAMEYMEGGNLASRIRETSISSLEAVWIAYALATALNHAHHRGVAHNDLKPRNVLFTEAQSGSWATPKLTDWGIAKELIEREQSVDGFTPEYAAPEQFRPDEFGKPDKRTDIYQLGVILYELLVGELPFVGPPAKLMYEATHGEAAPPTERDSSLPNMVDRVLLTALATRPEDWYEYALYFPYDIAELTSQLQPD